MPQLRALIVADHESSYIWDHFDKSRFEGVDVIISCGDLKASYLSFLTTMVAAPLYYVHGNHDGRYLEHPPEGCISLEDKMVEINGIRIFGMGGCKSHSPKPFHFTERDIARKIVRRFPQICSFGGFDIFVYMRLRQGLAMVRINSTKVSVASRAAKSVYTVLSFPWTPTFKLRC